VACLQSGQGSGERTALVFGCRNACGLADRIDSVEVDDIIRRLRWAANFTAGVPEILSVARKLGARLGNREPRSRH